MNSTFDIHESLEYIDEVFRSKIEYIWERREKLVSKVSLSEWLRSKTWNLMGFPRAGSNPAADGFFGNNRTTKKGITK